MRNKGYVRTKYRVRIGFEYKTDFGNNYTEVVFLYMVVKEY